MKKNKVKTNANSKGTSRRDFLKTSAVAGAGLAAVNLPGLTSATPIDGESKNPYGPRPGGGISLPEYYQPWPAIKNRNTYLPGTEILPKNEMKESKKLLSG